MDQEGAMSIIFAVIAGLFVAGAVGAAEWLSAGRRYQG